jgi:hypothetical protein
MAGSDHQHFEARRLLVQLTAAALLAQVLLVGWITPVANQMWREGVFAQLRQEVRRGGSPARGVRELTLPELWFDGGSDAIASPRARLREKHARIIVSLSPIVMAAVGLLLAQPGRGRRRRIATAWIGVPAIWFVVSSVAEASVKTGGPPVLLWVTPIALVAIAYAYRAMSDGARDGSPTLAHPRT